MNQDASPEPIRHKHSADAAIEDALLSYPLVDPPDTLRAAILGRVETLRTATLPRFRLTWLDAAVSLFGAGMSGLVMLLFAALPEPFRAFLLLKARFTLQRLLLESLTPVVMMAAAAILAAIATGIGLWMLRRNARETANRKSIRAIYKS